MAIKFYLSLRFMVDEEIRSTAPQQSNLENAYRSCPVAIDPIYNPWL